LVATRTSLFRHPEVPAPPCAGLEGWRPWGSPGRKRPGERLRVTGKLACSRRHSLTQP